MRAPLLVTLIAAIGCGPEETAMNRFFQKFRPDQLGTTHVVQPSNVLSKRGEYKKVLHLHSEDEDATFLSVSLRSEYSVAAPIVSGFPPPANAGEAQTGGPLVARVRWGMGGAYNVIEFDIPSTRFPDLFTPTDPTVQPTNDPGNGVVGVFFGSSFEVEVRNDNNLCTINNAPPFTPGALNNRIGIANPTGVKVHAFAGPGSPGMVPLRRSVYVAGGNPNVAMAPGPGNAVNVVVPSFAKRFWLFRSPSGSTPFTVTTADTFNALIRDINVPVNSEGPFDLSPVEQILALQNVGAVNATTVLVMFEVNPS